MKVLESFVLFQCILMSRTVGDGERKVYSGSEGPDEQAEKLNTKHRRMVCVSMRVINGGSRRLSSDGRRLCLSTP